MVPLRGRVGFLAAFCVVFAILFEVSCADSPKPRILLVDDAVGGSEDYEVNYRNYFEIPIENLGYSCDTDLSSGDCDIVKSDYSSGYNGPDYDTMKNYDVVVWFTGNDYSDTLTSGDMDNLKDYLDGGGSLFLTGQNIGFDINTMPFYKDYLKSDLVTYNVLKDYDSGNLDVYEALPRGISDDPVTDDLLDMDIDASDGAQNQDYPSEIIPLGSYVDEIFHYSYNYYYKIQDEWNDYYFQSNCVSAVRVDNGTYKLVYFAFGFEGLGLSNRNDVMIRVLKYLSAPATKSTDVNPTVTNSDPAINAACSDYELFSYVNAAEYFVGSLPDKSAYGTGYTLNPVDGSFDGALEAVNGTIGISSLSEGNHTIYVHCQDKSGYWGKFDSFTFEVDKTAPGLPDYIVIENNDPYTNKAFPHVTIVGPSVDIPDFMRFSCNEVSYTEWFEFGSGFDKLNITDNQYGCSSDDGSRNVYISVKDLAGNIKSTTKSDSITLDRVPPKYVPGDFCPLNNSYVRANAVISYNITDDWSFDKLEYNDGSGNCTNYSGSGSIPTGWSTGGEKRLDLWAYDVAGNINYTYLSYVVDIEAPLFDSVEPLNNSYLKTNVNLTVNVSDNYNISSFWYNNNVDPTNITVDINSGFNPNWATGGIRFLDAWANDSAGNVNHRMYRFIVDNTLPGIYSISAQNESNVTSSLSFVINTTDNYEVSFRHYNNGSNPENSTFLDNAPFVPGWAGDGLKNLLVWVIDAAGNVNTSMYSYLVDDTAPIIASVDPPSGSAIRSDLNITIDADDSGAGLSVLLYYDYSSSMYKAFSDNTGFNPGWLEEGIHYLQVRINDTLGNTNYTYFWYVIDNTAPIFISAEPENGSYVTSGSNITVTLNDQNTVDKSWYNNGSLNVTFDPSLGFNPGWNAEGNNDLYIWANDSAGNINETYYGFVVDDSPPAICIVSPANGSFIRDDDLVTLSLIDDGSGVDKFWYFNGSGANHTIASGAGFSPGWGPDGNYTLYVWSNDTLNNVNCSTFGFYVDTTGPGTSSNYSSSDWVNVNQDVLLTCGDGDGAGCNVTCSCVYNYSGSGGLSPTCPGYSESDVISVCCPDDDTCQKYVHFRSNDSLGNLGPANETSVVKIDKEPPLITIQNPKSMQAVSGMVDILTEVSDSGIGVDASWYDINVTIANGTLNETFGWDAVWNSSEAVGGNYNLTVYANDSFGYIQSVSVLFRVDDNLPAVIIHYPEEVYLNSDFSLDLRAARVDGNISNCSYYIYNTSDVLNSSIKHTSSSQCNFSWAINTSSWGTGNYSVNFSAFDELGNNASAAAWFIFDIDNPAVSISSPADGDWAKGVIGINYSTADDYIDKCHYRYKDKSSAFGSYYTIDCGSLPEFSFDTGSCSDTNNSGCLIQVNSTDRAGNSDHANVSFNVDNSLPVVSITGPDEDSWQNGTFSVEHSETDLQGQSCGYRVNGSGDTSWIGVACSELFDVNVSSYCSNEGMSACRVFVNSTNNAGDVSTGSRNFSIDLSKPYFVSIRQQNNSYLKSSTNIRVDVNDSLAGIAELQYYNGSGTKKTIEDNVYFNPGWTEDGNKSLEIWVADFAGNLNYSMFSYFVDDSPPFIDYAAPANCSSIRPDDNITLGVADDGAGIGTLKFDNNEEFSGNVSFYDNISFDPLWDSGGSKTLDLWLKDSLNNMNHTILEYFVDTIAPNFSVSLLNGSFIKSSDNITAHVSDTGIGLNSSWYNNGSNTNVSFAGGVSFNPGWTCEGARQIVFYANDSFGNLNHLLYEFVVDDSPPLINNVWVNVTAAKYSDNVLVSANISESNSVDSVFVDVSNTTMQNVDRVQLNNSGPSSIYVGTIIINGKDTGNYMLNISSNDTLGWTSYNTIEVAIDNSPPVFGNSVFDISIDCLYSDKRVYQNESACFVVNVSDRKTDCVIATLDAPYGTSNYSLSSVHGNYSDDTWNFTVYNASMPGAYRVSAIYANDSLGNMNVASGGLDEFMVVRGRFFVSLDGNDYISANENKSINITFDFNRTLDHLNLTVYVPENSPENSSGEIYFLNNSGFACEHGPSGCSLDFGTGSYGRIRRMNISGNSTGSVVSVYSSSVSALYPAYDSNFSWYADISGYIYSDSTLIRTPCLNISSVLCSGASGCVVNQSEGFVLDVTVDNAYQAGNHTGCAYDVVLYTSAGGSLLQLNDTLGDISSGLNKTVGWTVNITTAGNFTMSLLAKDAALMYNSSVLDVPLEVRDTEPPNVTVVFWDGPASIYLNESAKIGLLAYDNINISCIWASVKAPDNTSENKSLYLSTGTHTYGAWKLSYNKTGTAGSYNITDIFSNDTRGNLFRMPPGFLFNVLNLSIASRVSADVVNVSDCIKIYANVSSNATAISKVEVVINKPRGMVEVEELSYTGYDANGTYVYELDYDNVSRSGNYSVEITAYSRKNVSSSELFFANFGYIDVVSSTASPTLVVPIGRVSNVSWFIVPVGGDLFGVNSSICIGNDTVLSLVNGDSNISIGNVTVEDDINGYMVSWQINSSVIGLSNLTVEAESTALGTTDTETILLNVTLGDIEAPDIGGSDVQYNLVNLHEVNAMYVNVTDNSPIDNVSFEMHYPEGAVLNHTAALTGPGRYSLDFSNISEAGIFCCKIYAYDVTGNLATGNCSFDFNATDKYDVSIATEYSVYNKGETIQFTVIARNANNMTVNGYNLTLILNDSNSVSYSVDNEITDTYGKYLTIYDSPAASNKDAAYFANASVYKDGNSGNSTLSLIVSSSLITQITSVSNGDYCPVSSSVPINVTVTNKRNEGATDARVSVTFSSSADSSVYELEHLTSNIYVNLDNGIFAPSNTENFGLQVNAIDSSKNGGFQQVILTTDKTFLSGSPGSGGTSSTGSAAGVATDYMNDNNKSEEDEKETREILPRTSFDFTLKDSDEDVVSGFNVTFFGYIANTGETPLVVKTKISKDCCYVETDSEFQVPPGHAFDFPINIHVPLSVSPGEYDVQIILASGSQEKLKTIRLRVADNPDILLIERLKNILTDVRSEIDLYESGGFDVTGLKIKVSEIEKLIEQGENAIKNDEIRALSSAAFDLERHTTHIESRLVQFRVKKFLFDNKEIIFIFLVMLALSFYLLTAIILPYLKLRDALIKLKKKHRIIEQTKKATQKQYFMRKISDTVFNRIMIQEQDKLLNTRSEIAEIEEYMFVLKKGNLSEFRRLKDKREGIHKDALKRRAMEHALSGSTADFLKDKIENSKMVVFFEKVKQMLRRRYSARSEAKKVDGSSLLQSNFGISSNEEDDISYGDEELRESIERLKKAVSELDDMDEEKE